MNTLFGIAMTFVAVFWLCATAQYIENRTQNRPNFFIICALVITFIDAVEMSFDFINK